MKIYIDFSKQAITKINSDVAYVGDVYSNVFELLFFNYGDNADWFPTMSQLAPNSREAGDFNSDALDVDETYEHVENGITYMRYTFTIGEGWVRMKGRSNFFIWVNKLIENDTALQRKCYGKVMVTLNESTDNYFIQDIYFNPKIKDYIDNTIGDDLETYKSTIDDEVESQNETIASLIQASPSVFDTASNIQLLQENKGVAVATDTGYIYYWDSTLATPAYVSSGVQYMGVFPDDVFMLQHAYVYTLNSTTQIHCFIPKNATITFISKDGTSFTVNQIQLRDANKSQITYYALSGYGNKRTVTLNLASDVHYMNLYAGTMQDVYVVLSNYFSDKIDGINKEIWEINYYTNIVNSNNNIVPIYMEYGNNVTFETVGGENFSVAQVQLLDFNKSQVLTFALDGYGNKRVVTINQDVKIYYMRLYYGTMQDVKVTNNSLVLSKLKNVNGTSLDIVKYYNTDDFIFIKNSLEKNSDFTFLHITDLHQGANNFDRAVKLANYLKPNAILNTGDTVANNISESLSWYDDIVDTSNVDVLNCCGNHDVWSSTFVKANASDVYNKIIAPVVSKVSDIIQPSNATTDYICNYYKDYGNVRVISLNCMSGDTSVLFWDNSQTTWLNSVLADSITNSKNVVIMVHCPYPKNISIRDVDSNFQSYYNYITSATSDNIVTDINVINAVSDFITNGGNFVCWLSGHTHCDNVLFYNNQLMVSMASSKYDKHHDGINMPFDNNPLYDCMNYCSVDTTNHLFKVYRIGWNIDGALKKRVSLTYDYSEKKIIND